MPDTCESAASDFGLRSVTRAGETSSAAVWRGDRAIPALMLVPVVLLLLALVVGPIVGLDNYVYLLQGWKFRTSLWRSASFAGFALVVEMVLGFLLAAWVHRLRHLPGMGIVRTALTTPILIAGFIAETMAAGCRRSK